LECKEVLIKGEDVEIIDNTIKRIFQFQKIVSRKDNGAVRTE
jgi:hypothetical protein